jgi:hypothetical protein
MIWRLSERLVEHGCSTANSSTISIARVMKVIIATLSLLVELSIIK